MAGRSVAAVIGEEVAGASTILPLRGGRSTAASFGRWGSLNPTDFKRGQERGETHDHGLIEHAVAEQRLDLLEG